MSISVSKFESALRQLSVEEQFLFSLIYDNYLVGSYSAIKSEGALAGNVDLLQALKQSGHIRVMESLPVSEGESKTYVIEVNPQLFTAIVAKVDAGLAESGQAKFTAAYQASHAHLVKELDKRRGSQFVLGVASNNTKYTATLEDGSTIPAYQLPFSDILTVVQQFGGSVSLGGAVVSVLPESTNVRPTRDNHAFPVVVSL